MIRILFAAAATFAAGARSMISHEGVRLQENIERPWGEGDVRIQCSRACDDCARVCDVCAIHCAQLIAAGKKEHLQTLQTCQVCAAACRAASGLAAGAVPFSRLIGAACVEACGLCAESCERFQNDLMMRRCAEECRSCAKACRDMLGRGG